MEKNQSHGGIKGMIFDEFWQNFNLGIEVETAGPCICNGLRSFHEMETLHFENELFDVLYQLTVGL
jgi:hypothetical protein